MDHGDGKPTPLQILLNDQIVWEGPSPFSNRKPESVAWLLPDPALLEVGMNGLTISNRAIDGDVGEPPWELIMHATIYY